MEPIAQITIFGIGAVALVTLIAKAIIDSGFDDKYTNPVSLVLGFLAGLVISYETGASYVYGTVIGLAIGATAIPARAGIDKLVGKLYARNKSDK